MPTEPKMKACPFCGHDEAWTSMVSPPDYAVSCLQCDAIGPTKDSCAEAITAWNRRAGGDE